MNQINLLNVVNPRPIEINKNLFPSKVIGSTFGASYAYLDNDLLAAGTYYYWLESIDLRGNQELYGPVEVFR